MAGALLGRTEELARIDALIERATSGPAALVLIGEPGIGKSAIWSQAVDAARAGAELTVLMARAVEAEAAMAHVVLADLLGPVVERVLPDLPGPQADGLAAALLLDRRAAPVDARVVGMATMSVVRQLVRVRPVILAIDDLQWVDPASGDALGFALRRAWQAGLPIGLLATMRGRSGSDLPSWAARLVEPEALLEVGPVSLAVLHRLVRDRTGIALGRPQLIRLEQASLGNPLLALEMARALVRLDRWPMPGEPLPVPADIERLVAERLDLLDAADRRVLFAVAAATDPPTAELAAVLGRPPDDVRQMLDRAVAVALLEPPATDDRWRFAHPLYAAAALTAIPADERAAIHGAFADRATTPEERGRHAALATGGRDAHTADVIEAAAIAARHRGATRLAADWAEAAASRTPAEAALTLGRRRVLAARWFGESGDVERARQLLETAIAELPPGDQRAVARELAAQMAGWVDGPSAVIRLATSALDDAIDPEVKARILLRIANEADHIGSLPALAHADAAITLLRAAPGDGAERDPDLLACALLQAASIRYQAGLGDDAGAVAEASALLGEEPRRTADGDEHAESLRAHQLRWIWAAEHDQLRAALDGALVELDRSLVRGFDRAVALNESEVAFLALWLGDMTEAMTHAEAAMDAAALAEHPQARSGALSAIAGVALVRGDLERAEGAAREGMAGFPERGFLLDRHRAILGGVALARGDAASATAILGPLFDEQVALAGRESLQGRYAGDLIEAAVAAGDLARAEAVTAALARDDQTTPRPWSRVIVARGTALCLAARGDLDGADAAARRAIEAAADLPMPFERARTALIAGRVARRRKERARARALFDDAVAGFTAIGAEVWRSIAAAEATRLGRRTAETDGLTETERQVAQLAAAGLTNREVGEAAFLTPKSVEGVLARVYGKLGIRSRAELGAWLAGQPPPVDGQETGNPPFPPGGP
jgi:DNA-binding CsgD family transcriptional regulator